MNYYTIVRPEHLNQFNLLFGGVMLQWVDEYAYITAVNEFPKGHFVTRGLDKVEFTRGVNNGALLRFDVNRIRRGVTSVSYSVEVFSRDAQQCDEYPVFNTVVTMVTVDEDGQKTPLPV